MFNDNFDFSRDYINQLGRSVPYDFVNQVIPVIFKITGEEWLDVVTLPSGRKDAVPQTLLYNPTIRIPYRMVQGIVRGLAEYVPFTFRGQFFLWQQRF